jgi:CBS domain-containing protein
MYIRRIMKAAPVVLAPESTVAEARSFLRNGVQYLLVVDAKGDLVGMVSDRDLNAPGKVTTVGDGEATVDGIMARSPLTTPPEAEPEEALDLMLEYGIGALPVVSCRGELLGIVTYGDLLRAGAIRGVLPGPGPLA